MKFVILLEILFELLSKKSVSAKTLAEKYELSVRTIYRYMETLESAGVPLYTTRGKHGGFSIVDTYRLPSTFMTETEYRETIDALTSFESSLPSKALQSAILKLQSSVKYHSTDVDIKSGNLIIDAGPWGDAIGYKNKLTIIKKCIDENLELEISYHDRNGEITERVIEPHLILFKQGLWYVYAYCHLRNDFRFFKTGRIAKAIITNNRFARKKIDTSALPLDFWNSVNGVETVMEISPAIVSDVEEWIGVENVSKDKDKYIARATLPLDNGLVSKILSFGKGIKVISPSELKDQITDAIEQLKELY